MRKNTKKELKGLGMETNTEKTTVLKEVNGLQLVLTEYQDGTADIKVGDIFAAGVKKEITLNHLNVFDKYIGKVSITKFIVYDWCIEDGKPIQTYAEALDTAKLVANHYFDDLFKGCTQFFGATPQNQYEKPHNPDYILYPDGTKLLWQGCLNGVDENYNLDGFTTVDHWHKKQSIENKMPDFMQISLHRTEFVLEWYNHNKVLICKYSSKYEKIYFTAFNFELQVKLDFDLLKTKRTTEPLQ